MPLTQNHKDQMHARLDAGRSQAFEQWLDAPMTRFAISLIPPGEHPEALKTLLRGAFDAGVFAGQGAFGMELVTAMLERKPPDQT